MARTHVVGAGLAGLAAAVSLARHGHAVTLYEASGQAGGRCRSYVDAKLACTLDNGNHLLLSGNQAAMRYLSDIGASQELSGPPTARFPFLDLATGQRWCLRPNGGPLPWWLLSTGRRVPDTTIWSYLSALRFATAGSERTVTDCVGEDTILFKRFWEPLAVAVLNTPAQTGAARLLWPVFRDTFAKGEAACRPRVARKGLSDTFVEPALALLRRFGVTVRFGCRLSQVERDADRMRTLNFAGEAVPLDADDRVVLALPPAATGGLLPALDVPETSHVIVNAHFVLDEPAALPAKSPFLGLIGGTAQWLFVRGSVASITISAGDAVAEGSADEIARATWSDVAAALDRDPHTVPTCRVIKERRATFAQTPAEVRRRPTTRTKWANLFLAGDWIDTGLPATIEGAIQSGYTAASAVMR
ncbi:MAG: hydroxysqualene dehydroxylase HpnE [Rhodospirillales bacterium]|nr:hydroxysqualene dehydroxylase HpnE [Rhodospirillales bacterium]